VSPGAEVAPESVSFFGHRRGARMVGVVLVLVVVSRILLHFAAPAQLHHPEEFINLRLAATLLDDNVEAWAPGEGDGGEFVRLPEYPPPTPGDEPVQRSPFDFQYQDWDGGTLVVSVVLVPIALALGLGIPSVKLGALLWFLGLSLGWVLVLQRLYGSRGGRLAAVAFAAMPVPFVLLSSIHWGNHAESTLFLPYVLWALVLAAESELPLVRMRSIALAGLLAGFGAWFSLLNLVPMILVALLLPMLLGRRAVVGLLSFLAGAAVGFLPWLGRNDLVAGRGLEAQGQSLGGLLASSADYGWTPSRVVELFAQGPAIAQWDIYNLWSPSLALGQALDVLTRLTVVLCVVLALLAVRPRRQGNLEPGLRSRRFVLVVVVLNLVLVPVLLASQGEHSVRRLAPMYPLAWVCLCTGYLALSRRSLLQRSLSVLLALLFACHGLALGGVILSWDRPAVAMEPWLYFAVPEREARQRTEIGVPQVGSGQVGDLHAALAELLPASTSGGADEVRGLGRALAGRGTFLQRSRPGCPDAADVDIMELWLVASEQEARAVGRGLRVRCGAASERAVGICQELNGDSFRTACAGGAEPGRRTLQSPAN